MNDTYEEHGLRNVHRYDTNFLYLCTLYLFGKVTLEIDYFMKKPQQNEEFNTDAMLEDFQNQFGHLALTHGQMLAFAFKDRILQVNLISATDYLLHTLPFLFQYFYQCHGLMSKGR